MPRIGRWMVAPRLGLALAGAGVLLVTGTGIAQASQAVYGPPPPPVQVPGGYLNVVTSQTVGPGGGTIGPVSAGNTETTVVVPAGAFTTPLQVTITEPDIADIGNAGFCGYTAVAGVGVIIQNPSNGSVSYDFFTHPLVVTISSPAIQPGDLIVGWNGYKFVKLGVSTANGTAIVKITQAGYRFYAVLAPTGTSALDPCSTSGGAGGVGLGTTSTGAGVRTGGSLTTFGLNQTFLASLFGVPTSFLQLGLGVLSTRFARALITPARSLAAWRR